MCTYSVWSTVIVFLSNLAHFVLKVMEWVSECSNSQQQQLTKCYLMTFLKIMGGTF